MTVPDPKKLTYNYLWKRKIREIHKYFGKGYVIVPMRVFLPRSQIRVVNRCAIVGNVWYLHPRLHFGWMVISDGVLEGVAGGK